jgi:hypothetical protein
MLLQDLAKKNLIHPPRWLPDNCIRLTVMGSQAYGVSNDASDQDIYGVCIPPKELVFPHLAGEIPGFGRQIQRFEVWQEHRVRDNALGYFMTEHNLSTELTIKDVKDEINKRGLALPD